MKKVKELLALETRDQKRIATLLLEGTGKLMENDVNKLEFFNVEKKCFGNWSENQFCESVMACRNRLWKITHRK